MRNLKRILINSLVGLVLIIVWLQFINIKDVLKIIESVRVEILGLILVSYFFAGIFRSLRLKILLSEYNLPISKLIPLTYLSQLLSFLIPLRVGEVSKSVYLSSQQNLPFTKSVVWIFIDRFLDFWVDLLLILLLLFVVRIDLPGELEQIILAILLAFSVMPIFMIASSKFSKSAITFFSKLFYFKSLKEGLEKTGHNIIEGFKILHRNPFELVTMMGLTVLASVADSFVWIVTFYALGIEMPFLRNLLGSLLTALTFLIPAAPGYVGSAEAAGLAVFGGILGINANTASAAALINHIVSTITLLILGIGSIYLLKFNLSLVWSKISRK